jgi:hypothetical protein
MRLALIGCELLIRELCDALIHSPQRVDMTVMPKGLHDLGGPELNRRLQAAVDAVDPAGYDAVVLGYALCGNGLAGLRSRAHTVVVPRAHDCITLLLGSRAAFSGYFNANPGTYYRSVGWVERGEAIEMQLTGWGLHRVTLESLIERYGESNGTYLYEEYRRYEQAYSRLAYIESGLEPDASFIASARAEAAKKNWSFEAIPGNQSLFHRLLAGEWDDDFLIVPPGHRIEVTYDEDIVKAVADPDDIPRSN